MCVGIPARIDECDDVSAVVDISGTKREISMMTLGEPAKPGDWVLVHAGFAVSLLDPGEARETLRMMFEMADNDQEHIQ